MPSDREATDPFRLEPWDAPLGEPVLDAVCSYCQNPFASSEGYVSDDFSLCGACDARD